MIEQADPKARASLYKKIAAVAGAIEAVEKDGRNKDQGYRYASPAGIMAACKPLMAAQHLAIVPHLVEFAEIDSGQRAGSGKPFVINRVSMHYHILDGESGEELVVPWQGQAGTYGDDKGLAKAQTIALRTFLIQLFQIPAEDPESDPDARDAQPSQRRPPAQAAKPPTPPAPTNGAKRPRTRAEIEARFDELIDEATALGIIIEDESTDGKTDQQVIAAGKKLATLIDEAKRKAAMQETADLPL